VPVGDEDVSIGSGHDARRRTEVVFVVSADTGFAERHQQLPVRTEFPHHVPRLHARLCGRRDRVVGRRIGRPDIALAIDVEPVRPDEHLGAEAFHDITSGIEFVDGVDGLELAVGIHAVEAEPAAARGRQRARLVAADEGPDALAVDIDVNRGRRAHLPPVWKLRPLGPRHRRAAAIGQSPHRTIRIISGGLGKAGDRSGDQHRDAAQHRPSGTSILRHGAPPSLLLVCVRLIARRRRRANRHHHRRDRSLGVGANLISLQARSRYQSPGEFAASRVHRGNPKK
jgi:hypothetical protein